MSELQASLDAARAVNTGNGRFQAHVETAGLSFFADEPLAAGGLGSGPTPYQLLASALAACTTMTLKLYAAHKDLLVDSIETRVEHRRDEDVVPADIFVRRIRIDGTLDSAQRSRLLEIADLCPVHRTLTGGARIETVSEGAPLAAAPSTNHVVDMEALIAVGRGSYDFTQ
ncbi:Uncharacterized OsmC-related protein [Sphingobium sp. AP50]|uniref:OsmC family protein n=1 Tax=Sphingobium sp. AP50 TaxID=1884369 RepID=UPI0008BCA722|nr:OsmC family protein [Sphingobium sp. AP50]SEJ81897.1 Uncharacterized OsmC-related protein [Sphingobium sp. AP50]